MGKPVEAPRQTPPTAEAAPAAIVVTPNPVEQPTAPIVAESLPIAPERTQPPIGETPPPIFTTAEPSAPASTAQTEPAVTASELLPESAAETVEAMPNPVPVVEDHPIPEPSSEPKPADIHGHDHGESYHEEATQKLTPLDTILKTAQEKKDMCGNCQGTCPGCGISKLGDVSRVKTTIDLSTPLDENADPKTQALHEAAQTVTPGKYQTIKTSEGDFFGKIGEDGQLEGVWKVKATQVTPVDQPIPVAEAPAQPDSIAPVENPTPTTPSVEQTPAVATSAAAAPEPPSAPSAPQVTTFEPAEPSIATTPVTPTEPIAKSVSNSEPVTPPASAEQKRTVSQGESGKQTSQPPGEQPPRQDNKTRIHVDDTDRRRQREPSVVVEHAVPSDGAQPTHTVNGQDRRHRRIDAGAATDTKNPKQDTQPTTTRRERPHTGMTSTDTFRRILHAGGPQQIESSRATKIPKTDSDNKAPGHGESVPATGARFAESVIETDRRTLEPEQKGKRNKTLEDNKKRKTSAAKKDMFAATLSSEINKPEKRKKKRKTLHGKKSAEKFSFQKRKIEKTRKTAEKTIRKKKRIIGEIVTQRNHEHQKRQILSRERRAAIQARLRERAGTKLSSERLTREQQKPLVLLLPETTPVEQIAGAIILIAKEKRTKEKSPQVQIVVSEKTYRALKKLFTEAIERKPTKQTHIIEIVCGNKKIALDVEKIQLLEHLFADFEAQFLLLQLRQCLIQSEIKEATVLCGCQQQNAATSFEKISFCQGCHQGYIQQAFFWLITILWYTIYGMTLDQNQNQLYTQSYSYEQTILTS